MRFVECQHISICLTFLMDLTNVFQMDHTIHLVHARDQDGNFYTIINGGEYDSETTGLAFSPDNKHMYVAYQRYDLESFLTFPLLSFCH